MKQRADHGHQHADGGQLHAAAGLVRSGQSLEPEDEQHRGGQIGGLDQILAPIGCGRLDRARGPARRSPTAAGIKTFCIAYFRSWRLNILSIRSVIMKPPTTLIVAAVTARKPKTVANVP